MHSAQMNEFNVKIDSRVLMLKIYNEVVLWMNFDSTIINFGFDVFVWHGVVIGLVLVVMVVTTKKN